MSEKTEKPQKTEKPDRPHASPKSQPAKQERPTGAGRSGGGGRKEAAPVSAKPTVSKTTPRLKERYQREVVPGLVREFSYSNAMSVPRLEKIVLNIGLGEGAANAKLLDQAVEELSAITGQKGVITRARKSIANFKLREGMAIGARVTLRGNRMYEFLDRLVNVALPRVADFRGVPSKAFDGRGNYTLGLKDQLIFPEISYERVEKVKGMNLTFVTTARSDKEAMGLLAALGVPFQKRKEA